MNISMMVKNLNIYLLKQQKDTYMNMMCECLKGRIFEYIDLSTGEVKDHKCLFIIDIKTNNVLNFYSGNELLNELSHTYAKLISITTSSYNKSATIHGNPVMTFRTREKQVSLTIDFKGLQAVFQGGLLDFYRKDKYVIVGMSYDTLKQEISGYY